MRNEVASLLTTVNAEIRKVEKARKDTRTSAIEINASARHSPSQSGDREHAVNQAMLVETRLASLKLLENELTQANLIAPKTVENPCFVALRFDNKAAMSAYVLTQNVYLTDCPPLISIDSPLGQALLGKKVGMRFTGESPTLRGIILSIN